MAKLFPFHATNPNAKIRLLTLPFVGGGANVFKSWGARLPPWIELAAFELPGRGTRFGETVPSSMSALVSHIDQALNELPPLPLAIFGHSMGGRIGFQLAKRRNIVHFFASGSKPPQIEVTDIRSTLPRSAFRARLRDMGGTPQEILADEEMMEMVEPLLRADFALFESKNDAAPIGASVTAFGGNRDTEVRLEDAARWRECTLGEFRLVEIDAEHFFINDEKHRSAVLEVVAEALVPYS
ncbi:MAG: thioesterase [Polyangiaceae bacterium]|nr:thioesterase [Polyangiaceae bacterium]